MRHLALRTRTQNGCWVPSVTLRICPREWPVAVLPGRSACPATQDYQQDRAAPGREYSRMRTAISDFKPSNGSIGWNTSDRGSGQWREQCRQQRRRYRRPRALQKTKSHPATPNALDLLEQFGITVTVQRGHEIYLGRATDRILLANRLWLRAHRKIPGGWASASQRIPLAGRSGRPG